MNVARSSRYAAKSASGTPLTIRSPQNGGVGTGLVDRDVRPRRHLDLRVLSLRPGRRLDAPLAQRGQLGARLAPLDGHHRVHQAQALEGVACIADLAVEQLGEVLLDVRPRQRCAAEHHRPPLGDATGVELLEVLPHDHGALHEQAGHADHVGVVLLGGLEDGVHGLLDAEVDDGVAVVAQDDVDEVLADVVHVALDRGEHDRALAAVVGLLHVRLEVGDGGLHHLGGLQHERQLHLTRPEQLADGLHPGRAARR